MSSSGFFLIVWFGLISTCSIQSLAMLRLPTTKGSGTARSTWLAFGHGGCGSQQLAPADNNNNNGNTFLLYAKKRRRKRPLMSSLDDEDNDDDDDDLRQQPQTQPQLPFFRQPTANDDEDDNTATAKTTTTTSFVRPKMELQYTCNVCNTRNVNLISRIAYQQGVVIATCRGCQTRHVIADNLSYTGGLLDGTIEDVMSPNDVQRVSPHVFSLERVYTVYDSTSGSIVGDNGQAAME